MLVDAYEFESECKTIFWLQLLSWPASKKLSVSSAVSELSLLLWVLLQHFQSIKKLNLLLNQDILKGNYHERKYKICWVDQKKVKKFRNSLLCLESVYNLLMLCLCLDACSMKYCSPADILKQAFLDELAISRKLGVVVLFFRIYFHPTD